MVLPELYNPNNFKMFKSEIEIGNQRNANENSETSAIYAKRDSGAGVFL